MPLSLLNALASFQKYINKILSKKLDIFIILYLNNLFIHIKQAYIDIIYQVLDILQKYGLFANVKKCYFNKNEVHFLNYLILAQIIQIEDEKIKVVKNLPKLKSVQNIKVFLGFANFYQQFIKDFNKIFRLFISILRIANLLENLLILVDITGKDMLIGDSGSSRIKKNLSKSQKPKIL